MTSARVKPVAERLEARPAKRSTRGKPKRRLRENLHAATDCWPAAMAVSAPPFLIVLLAPPYCRRFARNPQVIAFVQGVTGAAVGAIAGGAVILGRRGVVDVTTAFITLATFAALRWANKVLEPFLISVAGFTWSRASSRVWACLLNETDVFL